jgi:hypothetical protein
MSEEKKKGSEILESALREGAMSDFDRCPRYEGAFDLGEDYADFEKRLLQGVSDLPKRRMNALSRRVSGIAAALIVLFSCAIMFMLYGLVSYETPSDQTGTSGSASKTQGTDTQQTSSKTQEQPYSSTETGGIPEQTNASTLETLGPSQPDDPLQESYDHLQTSYFRTVIRDGLMLELTVCGYKSLTPAKDFYAKNDEALVIRVRLTNVSDRPIYQWLPSACEDSDEDHGHGVSANLYCGEYKLNHVPCEGELEKRELGIGEVYEWQLELFAGEVSNDIRLYGEEIYENGFCTFAGNITFAYTVSESSVENDAVISMPISVEMLYVSPFYSDYDMN